MEHPLTSAINRAIHDQMVSWPQVLAMTLTLLVVGVLLFITDRRDRD